MGLGPLAVHQPPVLVRGLHSPSVRHAARTPTRAPHDIQPRRGFVRSPNVAAQVAAQQRESEHGVAAQAVVVPAKPGVLQPDGDGTFYRTLDGSVAWFAYHSNKPQRAKVVSLPADGILDLTVCLSLSGHNSRATLEGYALQDTHYVEVTFPDGHTERLTGIRNSPPGTREVVSVQDISIKLTQRGVYRIAGSPTPTTPGGYIEGRVTEIVY